MNVQYLSEPPSKMSHDSSHQILKDVAGRLGSQAEEDSKAILEALRADEEHDKEMEKEMEQLKKDLKSKQEQYDKQVNVSAGIALELNAAKEQHTRDEETIKKLGDAAEASTKAVKALEEDIQNCNKKFKNLTEERENISKKLKNQIESGKQCNEGRRKDKEKADKALAAEQEKTEAQRKLKEQYKQEKKEEKEECVKEAREAAKERAEQSMKINKLAKDVEREAAAVLASNRNVEEIRKALDDKTDENAALRSKNQRLEKRLEELKSKQHGGVPDGKHDIKVCRKLGNLTSCSTIENVDVKDGKVTGESIGKTDGDEKYSVEKGKGGKIVLSQGTFQSLKFNPTIKF